MSVQKAISSSNIKNNGSSILHGGSVSRAEIGTIDFGLTNMEYVGQPNVSGLTAKGISGGDFNVNNTLVAMALTSTIAGSNTNVLSAGAGIQQKSAINAFRGYNMYDIDVVNILTGEISYGNSRGDYVQASGINQVVGVSADTNGVINVYNVPHVLTYRLDQNSINDDYTPRTL